MAVTPKFTTRLAPSPSGSLHLGNAWSFFLGWLAARQGQGRVFLRIDDIDTQRCKREFADNIIADLQWLGLDWDDEILWQSHRDDAYDAALNVLQSKGLVYPCFCSRKDIRGIASAPHLDQPVYFYPGNCAGMDTKRREELLASGRRHSFRFSCRSQSVTFCDILRGRQTFTCPEYGGDFIIRRADGIWAYHLATAVDDAAQGVNLVLRGRDLLPSTPPQILLNEALNNPLPVYAHIPLLLNEKGERLAKRHHSLSLAAMRNAGISPESIIGFLAALAQCATPFSYHPMRPEELLGKLRLDDLPKKDIVISAAMLRTLGITQADS